MPSLNFADTKGTCHLAYDAERGQRYRFPDSVVWSVLEHHINHGSGFKAILVQPEGGAKDVTVLSFAGTDSVLDVLHDAVQALGGPSGQYFEALAWARQYKDRYGNLYLTGHSLGGGLAAYSSVSTGLSASTVNPAPLVGMATLGSLRANNQITNYIGGSGGGISGEIVSSSPGRNPGRDVYVPATGNFFTRHLLANVNPSVSLPTRV